ncbi:MAG: type II secretion system protein [Lachnospiraceae bacterium]|nr:type II secretion system protein [Lachnospiraceae bacterium]
MKKNWKTKKEKNCKSGFTLVELIVVLVILAILAAILVPALLGYIDRAREKKTLLNAKNCLTATQAELTELYAKNSQNLNLGDSIIEGAVMKSNSPNNKDFDASNTTFAKKVLKTADADPYLLLLATGANIANDDKTTLHDKYTVYYILYMETADSPPMYYYNGSWTTHNPRSTYYGGIEYINDKNKFKDGPNKGKRIQYYLLANKTGKQLGKLWDWLKKDIEKEWN